MDLGSTIALRLTFDANTDMEITGLSFTTRRGRTGLGNTTGGNNTRSDMEIDVGQQFYHGLLMMFALVAGSIIGNERQNSGHREAGRRTMSLISFGACLFTLIPTMARIPADVWRMPAAIIQGVGFLGAGVVMNKNGIRVKGLTTAAAIWVSAAIGICFGAGEIIPGIASTIAVYFILKTSSNKDTITDKVDAIADNIAINMEAKEKIKAVDLEQN